MSEVVLKSYHAQWSNEAYGKLPGLDTDLRHRVKADLGRIRKLYIEAMELRVKLKRIGLDVLIPIEQQLVAADRELKALREKEATEEAEEVATSP